MSLFKNYGIETDILVTPTRLDVESAKQVLDLNSLLGGKNTNLVGGSIFDMHRTLRQHDNDIQNMCYEYSDTYAKWRLFIENIGEIKKKYNSYITDYDNCMMLCKPVSFPYSSCYNKTEKTLSLEDWVWWRKEDDNISDEFSFDSEAEKKWAEVLKDNRKSLIQETNILQKKDNKYLWGKNFPQNSDIKFEYFSDGIHSSYPDFVLKDKKGRIHIFEVKSVNKSASIDMDQEEYQTKVRTLKECYRVCSKKTKHLFYLPIMDGSTWKITKFDNGEETTIDKQTFINGLA